MLIIFYYRHNFFSTKLVIQQLFYTLVHAYVEQIHKSVKERGVRHNAEYSLLIFMLHVNNVVNREETLHSC